MARVEGRPALSNGALDPGFGTGGVVTTPLGRSGEGDGAEAVHPLADGESWSRGRLTFDISSQSDFALVRYQANGELDPTFGANGIVITPGPRADEVADLLALSDGDLFVVGNSAGNDPYDSEFRLARYDSSGALDQSLAAPAES